MIRIAPLIMSIEHIVQGSVFVIPCHNNNAMLS